MADTKRTRRSSQDKWQADLQALEAKVKKAHENYLSLQKQYEELKKNPPTKKSRASVPTLIKALSNDPTKLGDLINESGGDQDKLKNLLLEALKSKSTEAKDN